MPIVPEEQIPQSEESTDQLYISPTGAPEVWSTKPEGYFTAEEWYTLMNNKLEIRSIIEEIEKQQQYLDSTDFKEIAYLAGRLSAVEFKPYFDKRQIARDTINALRIRLAEIRAGVSNE